MYTQSLIRLICIVDFIRNINRLRNDDDKMVFPSDEDLNGAAVALTRLQDTYNLNTHALAEGEILGKKYLSSSLTGTN
jgi:prolyl 4-hydroxylase